MMSLYRSDVIARGPRTADADAHQDQVGKEAALQLQSLSRIDSCAVARRPLGAAETRTLASNASIRLRRKWRVTMKHPVYHRDLPEYAAPYTGYLSS